MAKNRYNGPLSIKDITSGINHCIDNANRLIDDAMFLMEKKSWATACALLILSIEESGKVPLLMTLTSNNSRFRRESWRRFRNHHAKNGHGAVYDIIIGGRINDPFAEAFKTGAPHQAEFDEFKQRCLYVDKYANSPYWSVPSNICTYDDYNLYAKRAIVSLKRDHITEREVELFSIYMNDEHSPQEERLIAFREAISREGFNSYYNDFFERIAKHEPKEIASDIVQDR